MIDDETEAYDIEDTDTEACPFCGCDTCEHHALSLDLTFREVLGGALFDACLHRLSRISALLAGDDEDADVEAEAFEQLEDALATLPGLVDVYSEFQGGPGQSSAMRHYWTVQPSSLPTLRATLMWGASIGADRPDA